MRLTVNDCIYSHLRPVQFLFQIQSSIGLFAPKPAQSAGAKLMDIFISVINQLQRSAFSPEEAETE